MKLDKPNPEHTDYIRKLIMEAFNKKVNEDQDLKIVHGNRGSDKEASGFISPNAEDSEKQLSSSREPNTPKNADAEEYLEKIQDLLNWYFK